MKRLGGIAVAGGSSLIAASLLLAPSLALSQQSQQFSRSRLPFTSTGFTPAVADPRLAAELARRGLQASSFRFTPAAVSRNQSRAVRVAVRATSPTAVRASRNAPGEQTASAVTAITPVAYNLGVSVGWRRFAVSGDVARVQGGAIPGSRDAAEVGVSYSGNRFTGRLKVGAERAEGSQRLITEDSSYSVDVGGSYSIARNVDVTGGVRYKVQSDRLQPLTEETRDSQAVYIGTAFRF